MAVESIPAPHNRPLIERAIDMSRVNLEVLGYIVIVVASIIAHLWGLGAMAMHHDESIHAWTTWRFYTGNGPFTCALGGSSDSYCYDPVYHGPTLYMLTLLSFFLFGDGDAQARLPMALAGIGLVASCWWLRPYLGKRGALVAAVLLGFSPSLLYFTRFARHDGLMVLWELWMVIGIMRYLDTGKAGWLYLLAASLALAVGTHELYYILFFIFGILVLTRLIFESAWAQYLNRGFAGVLAASLVFIAINPPLPVGEGLYLGEKAMLVVATLVLTWLASRVWSPEPILLPRLRNLWEHERHTLWIALGILGGLYVVMYTNFFSYPRGALDGLYAGLAYWLGSQQEFARGDQPWYYYVMQLAIYEPLGLLCGLGAAGYLLWRALPGVGRLTKPTTAQAEPAAENAADAGSSTGKASQRRGRKRKRDTDADADADSTPPPEEGSSSTPAVGETIKLPPEAAPAADQPRPAPGLAPQPGALGILPSGNLFPLLLVVWYFSAIVIFSWAGEKMPWLVTHMALPGNLIVAWVVAKLLRVLPPFTKRAAASDATGNEPGNEPGDASTAPRWNWRLLVVPPTLLVLLVALGVAFWRLNSGAEGQAAQSNLLQGLVPLLIVGVLIYALLTLGQQIGTRVMLALAGLTLTVLLGGYMVRASWLAVYTHPDVPVELLVYTQTSPDVPRYVEEVRELAINQTRNHRSAEDVAGGQSMPVIISNGDDSGAGSLAWPLQWYLRDFQNIVWMNSSQLDNATTQTFEVQLPGGENGLAPVLLLFRPHVTENTRAVLEQHYVRPYGESGVFNWWFPEGNKCSPNEPGYKRFYFNSLTSRDMIYEPPPEGCATDIAADLHGPLMPLVWPLRPENLAATSSFLFFRELPSPLQPGSRDMEVWLRNDLVSGAGAAGGGASLPSATSLRLLAEQRISDLGDLNSPTGITVDGRGRIYVADTLNHQVQVYAPDGELLRTIGGQGSGEGQFYEPRGLAVDADDNLYVADTWNARIVKIGPDGEWLATWGSGNEDMGGGRMATNTGGTVEGNTDAPLGFFGPRGLAVDELGQVYVADTGNKRIVVTDSEGNFVQQWGAAGAGEGQFNEPTGVAVYENLVYVADTWNGRVQVFERDDAGIVAPLPITTWRVPGWEANTYDDPSIAVGPEGRVFASVPAREQVFTTGMLGEPLLTWGGTDARGGLLGAPSGMALDDDGDVYVVDRSSGQVFRFALPRIAPQE